MPDETPDELEFIAALFGDGLLAFEHAPVQMFMVLPNDIVLKANRALRELLGYAEGEVAGRSLREFVHHDDLERLAGHAERHHDGASSAPFVIRWRRRDGFLVSAHGAWSATADEHGTVRYIVGWTIPEVP